MILKLGLVIFKDLFKDLFILLLMYKFYKYNSGDIIYSIVTPIYNQETIIVKNLKSFIEHTVDKFEIILILDFCFDKTEDNLIEFLDNYICDNNNLI